MLTLLLLSLCIGACMPMVRYDGYKVLRMDSLTHKQIEVLGAMENTLGLDFWDFPRDMMVSPEMMDQVVGQLETSNIEYSVWIENVQDKIDNVFDMPRSDVAGFDYYVYHTYEEIMVWIDDVVATYPTLASSFSLGKSYEGRDLKALKIGYNDGKEKRAVWFNGCIHAREWVSPATVMWMTNALLSNYTEEADPKVKMLMEFYDFYILPMMNPDGYVHSWTTDRLWRKTRSHHEGDSCIGTDGNRNFPYQWGGEGSSGVSCSSTYRGPSPLSEVEVSSVVEFIRAQSAVQQFDLYIDYHSYGQLMLSPWGYTTDCVEPGDYGLMDGHMKVHTDAIASVYGLQYEYGPGSIVLYIVSGGSRDWAYGEQGIRNAYTIELRDDGTYGFELPESEIYPTVTENYEGLKAGLEYLSQDPTPADTLCK